MKCITQLLGFAACAGLCLVLICADTLASTAVKVDAVAEDAAEKINVVILTGSNNHNWKATTPVLKSILDKSGKFTVEVVTEPEQLTAQKLAKVDVLLSNWNTYGGKSKKALLPWSKTLKKAYVDFVKNGGGHVIVHAGSCSFYDWDDYQDICCATWKKGQTGHDSSHMFDVRISSAKHPITQGMENFRTKDELWYKVAVRPGVKVITEAYSKGARKWEPSAMVNQFGKGRCFALMLGHAPDRMKYAGFQTLLVRGTEWAGGKGLSDGSRAQTDTKASTLDQAEPWSFFPFCIGAHDAKKRTLSQQATMLKELGYEGCGYNNMRLEGVETRAKTLSDEGLRLFQVYFRVHLNKSEPFDEKRLAEFLPSLKPHKTQLALIIKGGKPSDRRLDDKAVAIIKRIADMARPYGVTVVFYHHGGVWLETCSDGVRIARKVNRPGEVGAMFNLAHWMRRDKNRNLRSVLQEAQPWLMAVSIQGTDTPEKMYTRQEKKAVVPLDESIYDMNEILDILRDIKYTGPIGLQCNGISGDTRLHLERSMGVWKRLSKKK